MTDLVEQREPASPCIGVCRINPRTRLCEGCFRNLEEIAKWRDYSAQKKRRVLGQLDKRRERILNRHPINI